MDETIESIALELYKQYGTWSVSVDDIAMRLGISKVAVYKKYSNKENLVKAVLKRQFDKIRKKLIELKNKCDDPILHILEIYALLIREMSTAHPVFLHSIKKYFPEATASYYLFQNEVINENLIPLYTIAKEKKIIRSDVNIHLLIELFKNHFDDLFSGNIHKYKSGDYDMLFRHIIINNMRGILTIESYSLLEDDSLLPNLKTLS